jgi:hypothetical protein
MSEVEYKCRWCAEWRGAGSFVSPSGRRCAKCSVCRAKPQGRGYVPTNKSTKRPLRGSHTVATVMGARAGALREDATMTKWERIEAQRAAFAAHQASGGTLTEGAFASTFHSQTTPDVSPQRAVAALLVPASHRALCRRCSACGQVSRTVRGGECDSCAGIS